jgi:type IV secretory pathway VirB2 component (pilin)
MSIPYDRWKAECMKTRELPVDTVNRAHKLNEARCEVGRAAQAAGMVPDTWAMLAAWLMRCAEKLLMLSASSYSARVSTPPKGEPMFRFAMLLVTVMLMPLVAFAQASMPADLPTDQALAEFMHSLGGLKGASALAITTVIVQAIMLFFRTPLAGFAGKYRLLIVAGLSLVVGFLGLMIAGVDWKLAFLHANTIGALQVFGHQVVNQFKPEAPKT